MKKKILIIHPNNYSIGAGIDAESYKSFFMSPWGGCWKEDEIEICKEQDESSILITTHYDRLAQYDYYICIFTGHGGIENNKLILEPSYGISLDAECLFKIAYRQLTIFDCCRTYSENETDSIKAAHIQESFSLIVDRNKIREAYEQRIAITPLDQYVLFACSPGQAAHGSSKNGGLFTHHLLNNIKERIIGKRYYTVEEAFNFARCCCEKAKGQLPEAVIPKELSNRQLIFGINPYFVFDTPSLS